MIRLLRSPSSPSIARNRGLLAAAATAGNARNSRSLDSCRRALLLHQQFRGSSVTVVARTGANLVGGEGNHRRHHRDGRSYHLTFSTAPLRVVDDDEEANGDYSDDPDRDGRSDGKLLRGFTGGRPRAPSVRTGHWRRSDADGLTVGATKRRKPRRRKPTTELDERFDSRNGTIELTPAPHVAATDANVDVDADSGAPRKKKTKKAITRSSAAIAAATASRAFDAGVRRAQTLLREKSRSMWEQVKHFPGGLRTLYHDVLTYFNINAATRTLCNAWGGIPPRRQLEEQRRLRWDLRVVAPAVAAYLVPFVGNLTPLVAVCFPRQMLSRQFHDEHQAEAFAELDYRSHAMFFTELVDHLVGDGSMLKHGGGRAAATGEESTESTHNVEEILLSLSVVHEKDGVADEDVAGPVIANMDALLSVFGGHQHPIDEISPSEDVGSFPSFDSLSRSHLVTLFLATGFFKVPPRAGAVVSRIFPNGFFRYSLGLIGRDILRDDVALIQEGGIQDGCSPALLTDDEVMAACVLRCLPTDQATTTEEMRRCLKNHLRMVESVLESDVLSNGRARCGDDFDESMKLMVLHLPAVRYRLKFGKIRQLIIDSI